MEDTALERALSRDRTIVVAALLLIMLVSWAFVFFGAGMNMTALEMSSIDMALGRSTGSPMETGVPRGTDSMGRVMGTMAMPAVWTFGYAILMFFMWWIMMIAMMLPSAAPTILLHIRIAKSSASKACVSRLPWSTAAFAMGYVLSWAGFSVIAVTMQNQFETLGLLSPMMLNSTNAVFAGVILIVAGLYQMTPLKQACLEHCQSPIAFLSQNWRDGPGGGLVMGLQHGVYCLGCCWGLMALLFFGGIMNLYWIIGLAMIVLIEKLLPVGQHIGRIIGVILFVWGASFVYAAL